LIAVLGLIPKFDVQLTAGVPITAQTLGVMLAGLLLGSRNGLLAVMLFLFVVALGAPVLSGGRGGLGVFFGPTVGFLIGWIAGAASCGAIFGALHSRWPQRVFLNALAACLLGGIVVIYAFGIPGLAWIAKMELSKAAIATLVFLPGDLIKSLLAAWLAARLLPIANTRTAGAPATSGADAATDATKPKP
jgi:biotin transport system substrate-specific component